MSVSRHMASVAVKLAVLAACGCGLSTRFAQAASEPDAAPLEAPSPPVPEAGGPAPELPGPGGVPVAEGPAAPPVDAGASEPPEACPTDLAQRLTVKEIEVDVDIRYRTPTYDNLPMDERVGFGVAGDGRGYIAWTDLKSNVRVTPLDAAMQRREPDIEIQGIDIGGFVVHDDGFALLTRRRDPGEPLTDPNNGNTNIGAAFLVRYVGRDESYGVPLTGTASITREAYPNARDCAPRYLYGRLGWNGVKYGAYFQVHGCAGDPHASYYADKLVYANEQGEFVPGGWDWNCGNNMGLRLIAEPGAFTTVCISDSRPAPGLLLVTEGVPMRQLSPEFTVAGYAAAAFGSIVKVPADGSYVVAWLSRGVATTQGRITAAKVANDVAMLRLSPEYEPIGRKRWVVETPNEAETNLHVAPYGRDRLLMVWDRITPMRCGAHTCFGTYAGTRARLMDLDGNPLSPDVEISAPPNTSDDITVLPNGDLGWALVPDPERNYDAPIYEDRNGVYKHWDGSVRLPSRRRLAVARMRVCD